MAMSEMLREITPEEIENFHRDGAVLLRNIMGSDWTEVLAEGLEYANDHPDGTSVGVSQPLRIDQWPASHSPKLKKFSTNLPLPK